ncbi:MAG: serine/threonine protein kinase [Planctomycetales bacterium]|nr:serine/threonine protein kinase [Planctomycetales bacterium]
MSFSRQGSHELDTQGTIEASFAFLENCIGQFAAVAPAKDPQQILELLPDTDAISRRLILIELIKFDLESAAKQGHPRELNFYWPQVGAELPQDLIPLDLVLVELHFRREAGEKLHLTSYRRRFPDLAKALEKWQSNERTKVFSGTTGFVPELPVGSQVDDFEILKELGKGAFARVYLARQESMHRLVALKATLHGSNEPQALSALDHPHIVRVYDQREIFNPRCILLYMQFLPGGTLADVVQLVRQTEPNQRSGKLILDSINAQLLSASQSVPEQSPTREQLASMPWAQAVAWIGVQLAEGLGYANEKGVLHRDIKPANTLLSAEAIAKLADFNVSAHGYSGRTSVAAYFGGSLAYMSPEQLRAAHPGDDFSAEQLDGRSDVYSLGILLWELWQGRRPWAIDALAGSWTEAVELQQSIRQRPFELESPSRTASEKVLEKVIKNMLAFESERRTRSGFEAAARLRLAFYPELAQRFEPESGTLAARLLSVPPLFLAAVVIFVPNVAASVFNYFYNRGRVIADFAQIEPELPADFETVANWVNGIVFPVGALLFFLVMLPVAGVLRKAREGKAIASKDVDRLWSLGLRSTLIGATLWCISGLVFAVVLGSKYPEFDAQDGVHFVLSLVLCGGVAWVYPYFGMTLLALLLYYPKVISGGMVDESFDRRCLQLKKRNIGYFLSAAAIPLTAIGALVYRQDLPRNLILAGAIVAAVGLLASFLAFMQLEEALRQFSQILSKPKQLKSRFP